MLSNTYGTAEKSISYILVCLLYKLNTGNSLCRNICMFIARHSTYISSLSHASFVVNPTGLKEISLEYIGLSFGLIEEFSTSRYVSCTYLLAQLL